MSRMPSRSIGVLAVAALLLTASAGVGVAAGTDDANDSIEDAGELSPGEYDLSVESEESDYFAVTLEENERLDASIAFDHDDADLDMRLLGPDEEPIDYSMSVGDSESVSVMADEAGEYYVRVYGYDGGGAEYELNVSTAEVEPPTGGDGDRFEPNDERENATSIESGSYDDLGIFAGEEDYFAVDVGEGERLDASVAFDHDGGDLDMALLGPDGYTVDRSLSVSDGESVDAAAAEDGNGTYYVVVSGYDGATNGYDLNVTVEDDPAADAGDRYEPNDRMGDAASIETGDHDGLSVVNGEEDYFAVSVDEGDRVSATIDFDHENGDLDLTLFGPDGDVLDSSYSTTDGESVEAVAESGGEYYVQVAGYDRATNGYDLTVSTAEAESAENDDLEPNDERENATEIDLGEHDDLRVVDGERDYYAVSVDAGERLNVDVEFDDAEGDLDLAVLGPDGDVLTDSDSTTDGESASVITEESGEYYVVVYGYDDATNGYSLSVTTGDGDS
mgnify:CR=1 FL=1